VLSNVGYPVLFALVAAESGGVPVPGETALITAGALAGSGDLSLPLVILVAAAAAIIGDNIGYIVARKAGRRLLERPGRFERQRRAVLDRGEPFFAKHGPKAVFLGRWILGLRVWASWLAGISHMPWPAFAFWNAAGGIAWAASIGTLAYVAGHSIETVIKDGGIAALGVVALVVIGVAVHHRRQHARG
jgi:membrane-associated protein